MPIIDLNKVTDIFVNHIRDEFNIQEKISLARIILTSIEHDHDEAMSIARRRT